MSIALYVIVVIIVVAIQQELLICSLWSLSIMPSSSENVQYGLIA